MPHETEPRDNAAEAREALDQAARPTIPNDGAIAYAVMASAHAQLATNETLLALVEAAKGPPHLDERLDNLAEAIWRAAYEKKCAECGHPKSWHRHDDATDTEAFRCVGYDCMAPGKPRPPCGCLDYMPPEAGPATVPRSESGSAVGTDFVCDACDHLASEHPVQLPDGPQWTGEPVCPQPVAFVTPDSDAQEELRNEQRKRYRTDPLYKSLVGELADDRQSLNRELTADGESGLLAYYDRADRILALIRQHSTSIDIDVPEDHPAWEDAKNIVEICTGDVGTADRRAWVRVYATRIVDLIRRHSTGTVSDFEEREARIEREAFDRGHTEGVTYGRSLMAAEMEAGPGIDAETREKAGKLAERLQQWLIIPLLVHQAYSIARILRTVASAPEARSEADWDDIPDAIRTEARRLVDDARPLPAPGIFARADEAMVLLRRVADPAPESEGEAERDAARQVVGEAEK